MGKTFDFFAVSIVTKHSFSLTELTRTFGGDRSEALMGRLKAATTSSKVLGVRFYHWDKRLGRSNSTKLLPSKISNLTITALLDRHVTLHQFIFFAEKTRWYKKSTAVKEFVRRLSSKLWFWLTDWKSSVWYLHHTYAQWSCPTMSVCRNQNFPQWNIANSSGV